MTIKKPQMITVPKHFGIAIRAVRKAKKMTQSDLADNTGTSVKFISEVERGKETAQIDKVLDLLRALGIKLFVTTDDIEKYSPPPHLNLWG